MAFDDLLAMLSSDLDGSLRAALGVPAETRVPRFTDEPGADADALPPPNLSEERYDHVRTLLVLLGSRLTWVRSSVVTELGKLGPGVRETLRAVRSGRTRARRGALSVLANVDWAEVPAADQSAVRRLIGIKQRLEVPALGIPQGSWFALPTTDQGAVLDAFGLRDAVPATMRMGFAAWDFTPSSDDTPTPWSSRTTDFGQAYVTPALDGWTLVFADDNLYAELLSWPEAFRIQDVAAQTCAALNRRFGEAHWYLEIEDGGCWDRSGWCVAEAGEVLRACFYEMGDESGPGPTETEELRRWVADRMPRTDRRRPFRKGWQPISTPTGGRPKFLVLMQLFAAPNTIDAPDDLDENWTWAAGEATWDLRALEVAWRLSVSPETVGAETRVEGSGVLAVGSGRRLGALPI